MSNDLPPEAAAAALAGLPLMTVHRLLALLRQHRPHEAFAVAGGAAAPAPGSLIERVLGDTTVRRAWRESATTAHLEATWERCRRAGIDVVSIGDSRYPEVFASDPLPPPVVFFLGDLDLLRGRRVGIVGTRNATSVGRQVALRFGQGLASAGVNIVSGLARGIDGQAHRGVLQSAAAGGAGRPIAVVASGLDVCYPREHGGLWRDVAEQGLLVSEWPPGSEPLAYRFVQRNRLVAAACEVLVVVESRERGGSLVTASLAAERGVPVMAVPGSAANRAASGVNELLRDGSSPALDVDDVLVALSLDHARVGPLFAEQRQRPRASDRTVYDLCRLRPCTIGDVADATDRPLIEVAMALARLEQAGWVGQTDGWYEVLGAPLT
ncbi:MAG: processing protein DprA [Actinomycetota bacterium]|jgi:DNA processing protein